MDGSLGNIFTYVNMCLNTPQAYGGIKSVPGVQHEVYISTASWCQSLKTKRHHKSNL
jgi:hypothetical protein